MNVTIQTKDGDVISGEVVEMDEGVRQLVPVPSEWLTLRQREANGGNTFLSFPKDTIASYAVFVPNPGEDVV